MLGRAEVSGGNRNWYHRISCQLFLEVNVHKRADEGGPHKKIMG